KTALILPLKHVSASVFSFNFRLDVTPFTLCTFGEKYSGSLCSNSVQNCVYFGWMNVPSTVHGKNEVICRCKIAKVSEHAKRFDTLWILTTYSGVWQQVVFTS